MLQRNDLKGTPDAAATESNDIDIFALLGALWRGKFTLIIFGTLALMVGVYQAYVVAVPSYRSSTALALELRNEPIVDIETIVSGASTDDAAMNTEVEIIRSRGILKQVVTDLNLTEDPEFNASLRPQPAFSPRRTLSQAFMFLGDLFSGEADTATAGPRSQEAAEEAELNRTISALRRSIAANVQLNTYIFNIAVTTWSPRKSQLIANRLAETYIADQVDQKFSATEAAVSWLSDRVVELEEELREREEYLKNLRTEIDVVSLATIEGLNRQLADARDRAADNSVALSTGEARLNRIAELRGQGDLDGVASFLNDAMLSRLVQNDSQPGVIDARIDALVAQIETDLFREQSQANTLETAITRLEAQINSQSEDFVRLQQAERELQSTRTLYETFLTRLKETTVQRGLAQADSRVLSDAIPGVYVSPQKSRIILVALIIGLLIGSAIVLVRQLLSKGYRSSDELEAGTGQLILGQIPLMPIKRRDQLISYLNDKPSSAAAEAVRNLRTSLLMSTQGDPQIIMSTSSLPGEGKTTMSISLSHNLAALKKRVLLIEGDVRRRTLDEYFREAANVDGGVIAAMNSENFEEMGNYIVRDERVNVDLMLGEKSRDNAADIFSSTRFVGFLDTLRQHYDYIVIDTPPVLIVPDARVIGQHADAIIFNVAWDRTSRVQVRDALRQLATVNLDVTGLVLGQIDPAGMKRYGYGGKYGSYAGYGGGYYDA